MECRLTVWYMWQCWPKIWTWCSRLQWLNDLVYLETEGNMKFRNSSTDK